MQVLQATSTRVLQHVQRLHCLTDNLALLDMLCAFASVATLSNGQYVRPKLTDSGPLAIVDGRHVLLENMEDTECQVQASCVAQANLPGGCQQQRKSNTCSNSIKARAWGSFKVSRNSCCKMCLLHDYAGQ